MSAPGSASARLPSPHTPSHPLPSPPTGLTSLCARQNAFAHLPAAVGAATALASLNLSSCTTLHLTVPDVDGILARCPNMRRLCLRGAALPEALAHLRQAAPQLNDPDSFRPPAGSSAGPHNG